MRTERVQMTLRRQSGLGSKPGPRSLLLLTMSMIALAASACGGDDENAGDSATGSKEPIVIGAAIARSGFMAAYDEPPAEAAQMAIEDINAKGGLLGRKLKYVEQNMKTDAAEAAKAATRVLDEGANLVITSCDFDFGAPSALEAQKKGVLSFSTCAGSLNFGPTGIGPLAFTMASASETQGATMAEFGYEDKGFRTTYAITNPGLAFEKELCGAYSYRWKQLGGEVVGEDTVQASDTNLSSQISRIRSLASEPDVIFLCTTQPQLASMLRQLRAAGIDSAIFGEPGFDGTAWQKAVPNADNVFFPAIASIFDDDPDDQVNEFVDRFTERTGSPPPSSYALTGYSVIEAFAQAVQAAKSLDGPALQAELEGFADQPLLVGKTTFTPEYHISLDRPVTVMSVQDGDTKFVTRRAPDEVPLPEDFDK